MKKKFVPHSLWMFQDSNFLQRSLTMIHQNLNLPFGRCSMYKSTVKTPLVVSITMDMIIPKVILLRHHGKQNVLILLTKKTLPTCQKIVFRQCLFVFLWFVYVRNILKLPFLETSYLPDWQWWLHTYLGTRQWLILLLKYLKSNAYLSKFNGKSIN